MSAQTFEDELRHELHRAVDHVHAPAELDELVDRHIVRNRRRGITRRAAAGGVVVALAVGIVASLVAAGGPATSTSPTQATPRTGQPGWSTIAASTVEARFQHTMVWTGTEVVVLGGYGVRGDGDALDSHPLTSAAAYDPATGLWRTIADYPFHDDDGTVAGAVWTGEEVLALASEGALHAWSPATDTWRELADGPFTGTSTAVTGVVWTGSELVVVNGGSGEGGAPDEGTAIYDPGSDTWRSVDQLPITYGFADTFWTGSQVVVVGTDQSDQRAHGTHGLVVVALDLDAGTWREVPGNPLADIERRNWGFAVWTGSELVVGGGWAQTAEGAALSEQLVAENRQPTTEERAIIQLYGARDVAAWDPATDTWRSLPDAPTAVTGSDRYADSWLGDRALLWSLPDDGPRAAAQPILFDPATGDWTEVPPIPGGFHAEAPAVWTGEELVIWSGEPASEDTTEWGCCRPTQLGETYTP
jgi:hypothetical protein